jgi:RNase H-fold protein (predicted Holliday junction resolvase)
MKARMLDRISQRGASYIVPITKYCQDDQKKEVVIGRPCNMHGDEKCIHKFDWKS